MSLRNSIIKFPDHLRDLGIQLSKKYSLPRWLVLIIDLSVVFIAFFLAYLLRFNFVMGSVSLTKAANQALLTLGVYALFMFLFQSYSGLIRHTTIKDIYRIFLATTSSVLVLILLSLAGREFHWTQCIHYSDIDPDNSLCCHNCYAFIYQDHYKGCFRII